MKCGPLLDIFPTGGPGGFRLVGVLDRYAAEPVWSQLRAIARSGLGITLDCSGLRSVDPAGLELIAQEIACSGGIAILITKAPIHIIEAFDRWFPTGHPGLLIWPTRGTS